MHTHNPHTPQYFKWLSPRRPSLLLLAPYKQEIRCVVVVPARPAQPPPPSPTKTCANSVIIPSGYAPFLVSMPLLLCLSYSKSGYAVCLSAFLFFLSSISLCLLRILLWPCSYIRAWLTSMCPHSYFQLHAYMHNVCTELYKYTHIYIARGKLKGRDRTSHPYMSVPAYLHTPHVYIRIRFLALAHIHIYMCVSKYPYSLL